MRSSGPRTEDIKDLKNADISKHLAREPGITFFACNVGQSETFVQALANALQVTVHAFKVPVKWDLEFTGESPKRKVSYRGVTGKKLPVPTITKTPAAVAATAQPAQRR